MQHRGTKDAPIVFRSEPPGGAHLVGIMDLEKSAKPTSSWELAPENERGKMAMKRGIELSEVNVWRRALRGLRRSEVLPVGPKVGHGPTPLSDEDDEDTAKPIWHVYGTKLRLRFSNLPETYP